MKTLKQHLKKLMIRHIDEPRLPAAAREQLLRDRAGLPLSDPGPQAVAEAGIQWLKRAQDMSASHDGGVARDFSLIKGWATSYPETTGYIIPTIIDYADRTNDAELLGRARRMLDWLVSIQFPEGGFQGGKIDATPRVPVTFNTGQILIGLAAGVRRFGDVYRDPMLRAAVWLRDSQDSDGCWRRHPTPFAAPGEKAYETHVSWGLFEAARLEAGSGFGEAGLKQVRWALTKQQANGWFASNCLSDPLRPLTHTIGYVLRGVIEAYRFSQEQDLLVAATKSADALLGVTGKDGHIPGRLDAEWKPAAPWVCLTGSVQIAACWFMLYDAIGKPEYRAAARLVNGYVRQKVDLRGTQDVRGGLKGAYPIDGDYGSFEFLNWATKFCVDAQSMEVNDIESDLRAPARLTGR